MIDYYTRIAPAVLPHLRGRPLTLKRYPNGVDAAVLLREAVPERTGPTGCRPRRSGARSNARTIDFCLANDLPTLVWLANLADLELHTSLALARGRRRRRR